MFVSALRLDLELAGASREAARESVRVIAGHLRDNFNVAVCDLDPRRPDTSTAGLAVVAVSPRRRDAHQTLDRVLDALRAHPAARIADPRVRIQDLRD
jgi:uncharacterized protein YlxP (DUF503 family)